MRPHFPHRRKRRTQRIVLIPILELRSQYQQVKTEIDSAVSAVLADGQFINGPNVCELEQEIAQYVGVAHAVALNSGTDALHLALRAMGIGPGDEVITSPFSFIATTEAIGIVGAKPIFADIDRDSFTIDPPSVEAVITPRTRAIIPVHLYGAAAPMRELNAIANRYRLAIVEDCAQAIGAELDRKRVGSFGVGCFSFFPSKNLGAYGDGGMLTTDDPQLAARVRSLRAHGGRRKYYHEELGVNSRLDEIQAAILRVKLRHLDRWIEMRRHHARGYSRQFESDAGVRAPREGTGMRHVFHQYTVRLQEQERDRVQRELLDAGVQTAVYYPVPLHRQIVHAPLGYAEGDFPQAEAAAREVLSLPIFPELSDAQRDHVARSLIRAIARQAAACAS